MKQVFGYVLFSCLLLLAFAYLVAILYCGSLIEKALLRIGPATLQAPLVLAEATLGPVSGKGTLTDLRIGNPAGWSRNPALRISRIQVQVKPFSTFDNPVPIEELEVESAVIDQETRPGASNLSDLLRNAERALRAPPGGTGPEPAPPVRFIVHRLVVRNVTVNLSVGGQFLAVEVPEFGLVDLGVNEGGLTATQLGFAVMRSVTASVTAASIRALGHVDGAAGAAARENAQQIAEAIRASYGVEKRL